MGAKKKKNVFRVCQDCSAETQLQEALELFHWMTKWWVGWWGRVYKGKKLQGYIAVENQDWSYQEVRVLLSKYQLGFKKITQL